MNNSNADKEDGNAAMKTLQIVHKKTFKGSSLPPQISCQDAQKGAEFRNRAQTQLLPRMKSLLDIEQRAAELELRATQAEEYRYELSHAEPIG